MKQLIEFSKELHKHKSRYTDIVGKYEFECMTLCSGYCRASQSGPKSRSSFENESVFNLYEFWLTISQGIKLELGHRWNPRVSTCGNFYSLSFVWILKYEDGGLSLFSVHYRTR